MRPTVTHTRLRGPTGDAVRARRRAANEFAIRFITAVKAAMADKHPEFCIETSRMMIRGLTSVIEDKGDAGRALGVLNGASIDLAPTYRDGREGALSEAEVLFSAGGAE